MSTLCRTAHSVARPRSKSRAMPQVYMDVASAWLWHAAIGKLLVPSKEAVWHMRSKRFQNGISQFDKKIRQSSLVSFHSFCNPKVCKNFFFHVDTITLAAYTEQLLPRSKAALCCILPHGIVWTRLYDSNLLTTKPT